VVKQVQQPDTKSNQWVSSLKKEQIILLVIAFLLFMMLLFPPYLIVLKGSGGMETVINQGYGFILVHPVYTKNTSLTPTVNIPLLGLQCLIVSIVGGLLYVVFKEKE
jgi:hypothetical protein